MMRAVTENNLAAALQEDDRLDEALVHYERAAAIRPDYAPAYNNMGTALRAKGRVDEAIAAYRRALETMPDYPDAHYNLANALMEQNRSDEAAAHLLIASRSLPSSAGVHTTSKALADRASSRRPRSHCAGPWPWIPAPQRRTTTSATCLPHRAASKRRSPISPVR
jgi:tetratricopeptide (TPR) repeat protein